jgi:lysyl-tRNA synthetase class 2
MVERAFGVLLHKLLIIITHAFIFPQQYYELRCRQVQKLRETQSPNPYPHKFHVSSSITAYITKYGPEGKIPPGQRLQGVTESLAGRIHNIRASGQKLRFYDLHGEGKKVQIMATLQQVFSSTDK